MKKGGFLRNVLDTIRSNQAAGSSGRGGHGGSGERVIEFGGQLKPSHFSLCQVARHGFPDSPTALAFDPVQKIAAIGTKTGAIRVFGRPGVDVWAQHEPAFAVTHMKFIINQGAIITVTSDESIHLWSLRGPTLRLLFSSNTQGVSGTSPQASSPAPTSTSNISSVSPQSASSIAATGAVGASTATSSSSFLGQITDTVSGAVDSASDFLSGGVGEHQTTPSPTGDARHSVSRKPEILHTLKFQREHITFIHQTLLSKWLYIGTERGNVHVANVETFELSGYSIAWNKAIELSRKTHPGSIIHISECPQDTNKLLIGYESGCIVIWDLKQRNADGRYYYTENLLWLAWHYEGKQFVAAHGDGSLITWSIRSNARPTHILHPHAKTTSSTSATNPEHGILQHQQSLSSSFARSLNNELYRPINKVEWKTSKSNGEPFYLFSGGLPYDGIDSTSTAASSSDQIRPTTASLGQPQRQQALSPSQQLLRASSASPGCPPVGMAQVSPNWQPDSMPGAKVPGASELRQPKGVLKEKKFLRSTSLTVMYGKSITVLEMDDTIIDFIAVCDNSPYENDTSDPYAVIVLLSNELILIDLTSSGYPSFDSPYPSASLNESPVTCVQYLADCSSDLIPFLYSTSQNVISRAPKKGFSDKEWPINGGEWGQSMQSYPELVLTGHADGTIKFWDMSGVNFDLISKIKTTKLFEKPSKPPNAIFLQASSNGSCSARRSPKPNSPSRVLSNETEQSSASISDLPESTHQISEEDLFAIEKIEFCSTTKRLLVAGACAQVMQFRLNKKDPHSSSSQSFSDLATIVVEPSASNNITDQNQTTLSNQQDQWKKHCLFQVKASHAGGAGSSSGGSSSSSSSHRNRGLSGFQAEIVCQTPLLISAGSSADDNQPARNIFCQVPPRITALTFQPTHNILAYAHEYGIVLVDIIQKCVIINATLNDLSVGSLINASNRDISIQPYATSSILQHHYQANAPMVPTAAFTNDFVSRTGANNQSSDNGTASSQQHSRTDSTDDGRVGSLTPADPPTAKSATVTPDGGQLQKITKSNVNTCVDYQSEQEDRECDEELAAPACLKNVTESVHTPARHSIATATLQIPTLPTNQSDCSPNQAPLSSIFTKFIDKFDSSFRRSRSSSTSSTTGHLHHQQSEPSQQQLTGESILCIAFLDPAQMPQSGPHLAGGSSQAGVLATNMTNSSSQASQAGGASSSATQTVAASTVQSSAGLNHKSLSSIDNQQTGQLALWLGTSLGGVLLVCLQMPDNEDNRILQLQSISAEPIPNASVKLSGQILCIAPFTCEARLQPIAPTTGGGGSQMSSSSGIQSASQSSSLEGDTHLQSPSSPGSSVSAIGSNQSAVGGPTASSLGSVAPSSGIVSSRTAVLDSPANVSFDSRSSLFIAVVSEKEARVYQVPPSLIAGGITAAGSALGVSSSATSRTAAGSDHHHASHHHGHSASSAGQLPHQGLQDSPLGALLTNKKNLMARCELSDTSFACRSAVVQMRSPEESCLVSYLATGNIVVHSLPRLKPILMDADFVPYSSARLSSSMCMSRQGHCLYQPSSGEICKFTVSAQYKSLVNEMIGLVYVPREMPEMPRTNFFKSLFSVSQSARQSDRDELFGECSAGKPSRGVAKHIGTTGSGSGGQTSAASGLEKLKGAAIGTMGHDIRMAREGLDERGEKLSEIEDRTLSMMNQSEGYAQAAHQLAQKFKDKKWYQF